jgi:endo-beta-N-acetylglucosaminidase D
MRKGQIFLALLLVSPVVLVEGCVVAAVGGGAAGTVAYIRGDLEAVEAKDIETVYKATEKALEELGLVVSKKTKDALSAKIIARDAQDKKITIKLNATTEETTKLSIRIGTFGSETKSRLIYQKICDNL